MNKTDNTWSQTTPITGPSPAQDFYVGLQCRDMPTDGQVGMQVTQPAPLPPITVPMTPIANPNMNLTVLCGEWPAGGEGAITIDYRQGHTPPPSGAAIIAVLFIAPSPTIAKPMTFAS